MGLWQSYPVVRSLPGNLSEGKVIVIKGRIPPDAVRFAINLVCEDEKNIAFHFNPRFDNVLMVVCNTMKNGRWGAEQRSYDVCFVPGESFKMTITVMEKFYQVSINDKHFLEYRHRLPLNRVWTVQARGHVDLTTFNVTAPPPYSPEPSIEEPPAYSPSVDSIITDRKAPLPDTIGADPSIPLQGTTDSICVDIRGNFSHIADEQKIMNLVNSLADVHLAINPNVEQDQISTCVSRDRFQIEINNK